MIKIDPLSLSDTRFALPLHSLIFLGKSSDAPDQRSPEFEYFQLQYPVVYLLTIAADWLPGPNVYALYTEYGYTKKEIGQPFIAGFGSSAIFGTFIGLTANRYGRKFNTLVFVVTNGLYCHTKHSPIFGVLMIGRLLAGVATSILFSAFEAWLVSKHKRRGFEPTLISDNFFNAHFGNTVVAIISRQVAAFVADRFGKVSPFDTAAAVLLATGLIFMLTWGETFGDSRQTLSAVTETYTLSISGGLRSAWMLLNNP